MKKGFTLIELLAVIVILAIIALIATPIILNIIGNAKDESNERSKELYLRAVNQAIAARNLTEEFNPSECTIQEDGNLLCGDKDLLVEVSGIKPCSGTITFDKKGKITNETVTYCNGSDEQGDEPQEDEEEDIDTSGANEPELMDSLTPVIYNTDHWEIADTTKNWYNYDKQEWANAVILNDEVSTSPGTRIYPDGDNVNIKAMLVWIPRYEYKIDGQYGKHSDGTVGTQDSPGEIEVNFIAKDTTDATSGYTVHPAFNFGGIQLSGIWLGKFETTGDKSSPTILPNIKSLRSQTVGAQFEISKLFNSYINSTGDAHMAKNSEWGAVAYLSQSKYGKYGNNKYSETQKEVYKNNSKGYYTGRSGGAPGGSITQLKDQYPDDSTSASEFCTYGYYTYEGYKINYDGTILDEKDINKGTGASTTGNITGIYDMSGGANDYVMGYLITSYKTNVNKGLPWGSTSTEDKAQFTSKPDSKYFDAYENTDAFNDAYKGQALGETNGWYNDYAGFVSLEQPWYSRGGLYNNTNNAGVFFYGKSNGNSVSNYSFRIALVKII